MKSDDPLVRKGQQAFNAKGCVYCHGPNGAGGVRNNNAEEGSVPALTQLVADGFSLSQVRRLIQKGERDISKGNAAGPPPPLYMPAWNGILSDSELDALVAFITYLQTKGGRPAAAPAREAVREPVPASRGIARGRELFYDRMRCVACHVTEVDGKPVGGILGPNLSRAAERLGPKDLARTISSPPGEIMPKHFAENMSDAEIRDLVGFLSTLHGNEPPPAAGASRVERGKWLFQRKGCFVCHGEGGRGGVQNYNYVKNTVPALNVLSERLMLFDPQDAAAIVERLEKGADLEKLADDPPIAKYNVFLARYKAVRDLIRDGNRAGKKDPAGPQPPMSMPSWRNMLSDKEIDDLITYLITLEPPAS